MIRLGINGKLKREAGHLPQSWPTPAVRGATLAPGPPAKPANPNPVVSDTLAGAPIT